MPKKILLIDVSHLFFRAFFAIPRGLTSVDGEPINAIFGVSSMLLSMLESECPQYIFGAKDEKEKTKRHELVEEYKGQRPEMPSELVSQLPKIFDIFAAFHIPLCSISSYEADDMIATIAEKYRKNLDFEVEAVSGDHDIFQLVGDNVYMGFPQNGGKPPLKMGREEVFTKCGVYPEQIPDYKSLVGDASDNFKGVDGVGKVTAAKLLQTYGTLEGIYEHLTEIPGKLQEKLAVGKERAIFLKPIATLHRDLELPEFELEKGNVNHIDFVALEAFFKKMQFHSLLNRLPRAIASMLNPVSSPEHDKLWREFEEVEKKSFAEIQSDQAKKSADDQMALF